MRGRATDGGGNLPNCVDGWAVPGFGDLGCWPRRLRLPPQDLQLIRLQVYRQRPCRPRPHGPHAPSISWIVTLPADLPMTEPGALEPPAPALLL